MDSVYLLSSQLLFNYVSLYFNNRLAVLCVVGKNNFLPLHSIYIQFIYILLICG